MNQESNDRKSKIQPTSVIGVWVAIGAGIGIAFGSTDNISIGIAIGAGIGVAIGAALDLRRNQRNV